ncbi:hypothetical protein [Actinoallomurus sp. CA-142502]|uniref:WXG100-like domain-containing protein n=1 Tax=Actinoallomurus sp. CA-142502 TaxID=3239885 RepID=UPI003D8E96ED
MTAAFERLHIVPEMWLRAGRGIDEAAARLADGIDMFCQAMGGQAFGSDYLGRGLFEGDPAAGAMGFTQRRDGLLKDLPAMVDSLQRMGAGLVAAGRRYTAADTAIVDELGGGRSLPALADFFAGVASGGGEYRLPPVEGGLPSSSPAPDIVRQALWLFEQVGLGFAWPDGNVAAVARLADTAAVLSRVIDALKDEVAEHAGKVTSNGFGDATEAFGNAARTLHGPDGLLTDLKQRCDELAAYCRASADAIITAQRHFVASAMFAVGLMFAVSTLGPPVQAWLGVALSLIRLEGQALQIIVRLLFEAVVGGLFSVGSDALDQQFRSGRFDWSELGGALGQGLILGGLMGGARAALPALLRRGPATAGLATMMESKGATGILSRFIVGWSVSTGAIAATSKMTGHGWDLEHAWRTGIAMASISAGGEGIRYLRDIMRPTDLADVSSAATAGTPDHLASSAAAAHADAAERPLDHHDPRPALGDGTGIVDNGGQSIASILNKDAKLPPTADTPEIISPPTSRPATTAVAPHDHSVLPAKHPESPYERAKLNGAVEHAISHSGITDDLSEFHVASHNALLEYPAFGPGNYTRFDGIIVPTVRPDYLHGVGALATLVETPLVVLCGEGQKSMVDLALSKSLPPGDLHVLEVMPNREHGWLQSAGERYPFSRSEQFKVVDIAGKRNLGLIIARMAGWEKIIFLDDDIGAINPSMLGRAAELTERYRTVGFQVPEFPDNSVVGHAYRLAGGPQHVFVGGGGLAVKLPEHSAFYPSIYNEDWLYLHDAVADRSLAVSDWISQLPYDPFTDPSRAVKEEFGDLIAEGLFRLLHTGSSRTAYTEAYWEQAIKWRTAFIEGIAERLGQDPRNTPQVAAARTAVNAAGQRLARITPQDCLSFVTGWRTDQEVWKRRFDRLPVASSLEEATDLRSPIWDRVQRLFADTELAAANGGSVTNGTSIVEFVKSAKSPVFILGLAPSSASIRRRRRKTRTP